MPLDLIKIAVISLTGLINLFLGFLVLIRNPKNTINKVFFFIGLSYGIRGFCLLLYEFPIVADSLFWIRAAYIAASLIEIFVLAFSFIFPKPVFRKAWVFGALYSMLFLGLTFYLLFFTNTWVLDVVRDQEKGLQTILGDGYILWLTAIWGALLWSIFNLVYNLRNCSGRNKIQLIYLLSGFSFFGVFATLADIVFPLAYKDTGLFSISTTTSLFFTFTAAYVIIKHRFLDIRFVVARSVAYICLVVVLGVFYTGGLFFLSASLIKQETYITDLIISTILALFMVFTFQPLKKALEKFTDAIFYQAHYDTDLLLAKLGSVMSTNIELKPLTSQMVQILIEQMRISKGALVILGEEQAAIYDMVQIGFPQKLTVSYNQISVFCSHPEILVFDELEENRFKDLMRNIDISVVKTLRVKGEAIGFLMLGEKSSGGIYSNQDLKALEILAPEMAVAIQNALGYDKIKKFNVTLSEEVRKATMDLQDANSRLKTIDKLKDDFVSIASHELRTPMTAIRSYAWMALHRSGMSLPPNLEKYITRILISTERLVNLVNDMLNISRIESGRIEINPEPVDLLSLVKDIIDEVYYSKSEEKKINFVVLEKPIPKAFADPEKLRQVFLNLVGNSLKFTPGGGKITFDFFTDGKTIEISVSDTGVGISKEDLSKLFYKFSRLDNSYTAAATSGGTGLGLYISKNLVQLMHGKIWVTSEGEGKGASFVVALPVATPEVLRNIESFRLKPEGGIKHLEPVAI